MWFWISSIANSATLVVPLDQPTLADAVGAAGSGDTIWLQAGTYTEAVWISGDLTIQGEPGAILQAPAGHAQPLYVTGTVDLTLRDLTFDGQDLHRGLHVDAEGQLTIEGCTFSTTRAPVDEHGGAILIEGGTPQLTVTRSTFDGGAALDGGHLYVESASAITLQDNTFLGGSASDDGGAVLIQYCPDVTLEGNTFAGNDATDDGGAIMLMWSTAQLSGSLFCDNLAGDIGGAIDLWQSYTTVVGNVFLGNQASDGGALYANSHELQSRHNHFVGNEATGSGAAIYTVTVNASVHDLFAHNVVVPGQFAFHNAALTSSLSWPLLYDHGGNDTNRPPSDAVYADPLLTSWPTTQCSAEAMFPLPGSAAIDAGDPHQPDLDGSPSDIGAFGGSEPFPLDRDDDGALFHEDCDDTDPLVHPDATEVCNGLDDDCSGAPGVDEIDADGDGILLCDGDCDDSDGSVWPGGAEIPCDGLDNDCDPGTPDAQDADGDGAICDDCDGSDATVFPGADEGIADDIDQDCDGNELCFADRDGDGFGDGTTTSDDLDCDDPGEASVGGDCDDTTVLASPAATEIAGNGLDDDCDPATPDDASTEPGLTRQRGSLGSGSGCGCASGPAPGWLWAVLAIGAVRRRSTDAGAHDALDRAPMGSLPP